MTERMKSLLLACYATRLGIPGEPFAHRGAVAIPCTCQLREEPGMSFGSQSIHIWWQLQLIHQEGVNRYQSFAGLVLQLLIRRILVDVKDPHPVILTDVIKVKLCKFLNPGTRE